MKSSLAKQITAYFVGLFFVTISLILLLWYFGLPLFGLLGARDQVLGTARHTLEFLADHQESKILDSLVERQADMLILAENKGLNRQLQSHSADLQKDVERVFDRLIRARPDRYQAIYYLDPLNGQVMASDSIGAITPPAAELILRVARSNTQEMIYDLPGEAGPSIAIIGKVHALDADGQATGKLISLVVAQIDPQYLISLHKPAASPEALHSVTLRNQQGKVITSNSTFSLAANQLDITHLAEDFEGTIEHSDAQGRDYLIAIRRIYLSDSRYWTLVLAREKSLELNSLKQQAWALSGLGLIMAILSLLLIIAISRRLTAPLNKLADTARQMRDGKLSARAAISPDDSQEITELAQGLNQAATSFQRSQETLENKVAERTHALALERDTAQRYLDIADVMLIVLDLDGRTRLINRKCSEILGLPEQNVVGQSWIDMFIPIRQRDLVRAIFNGLLAGNTDILEFNENFILNAANDERLIAWHNVLLYDETGKINGILSSGTDVTELRQAEAALRRYRNEEETASGTKAETSPVSRSAYPEAPAQGAGQLAGSEP